jgi:hypothetical protein
MPFNPRHVCELPARARIMSKLYAGFHIIASLFAMMALGMLL